MSGKVDGDAYTTDEVKESRLGLSIYWHDTVLCSSPPLSSSCQKTSNSAAFVFIPICAGCRAGMRILMIGIVHRQQVNDGHNWKCGAVSLQMIFDYYRVPFDLDESWEYIRSRRPNSIDQFFARTCKLSEYSIAKGLMSTIYKGSHMTCLRILDILDVKSIPAIASITQKRTKQSHFVVFTGCDHGFYCFCDPDEKRKFNRFIDSTVYNFWKPNLSIDVTGYILVVFEHQEDEHIKCPFCNNDIPIVHSELKELTVGCICPYCDKLLSHGVALV